MTSTLRLLAFITMCAPLTTFAACQFYEGHSQKQIKISLPSTLPIPRDTENNTTLYESPPMTFYGDASYLCSTTYRYGVINNAGTSTDTYSQPIGNTGLSWQWIYNGEPYKGFEAGYIEGAGGYGFNGLTAAIRIIKTGKVSAGATVPAGTIGFFQVDSAAVRPLAMILDKSSSIILQSCETPDINVAMGEYDLSEFSKTQTPRKRWASAYRSTTAPAA